MPATVQDLITAAVARNSKNRGGAIVDVTGEMLNMVDRSLKGFFAVAARVNPDFFPGALTPVAYSVSDLGWPLPSDQLGVVQVEMADGTEVDVLPRDGRGLTTGGAPAVYRFGNVYRAAGGLDGPTTSDLLRFWYPRTAVTLTAVGDQIDADWPEAHNNLLVVDIALYLAKKDSRGDEINTLRPEWDYEFKSFLARLRTNDASTGRFTGFDRVVPNTELMALTLGGGAG